MKRQPLIAIALFAFCAPLAWSSFIDSHGSAQLSGQPASSAGSSTAGQAASVNLGNGQSVSTALTTYGTNHAYVYGLTYQNFADAFSQWDITFTLAGNGLSQGTYVPLTVSYQYDFNLTAFAGFGSPSTGYVVSATFGIVGNGPAQGLPYDVFSVRASSNADGGLEYCPTRPGPATPQYCLGGYSGSGSVTQAHNWFVGPGNSISGVVAVSAALGSVDAYNTAMITGILVPNGITWTYGNDANGNPIAGNPLNFGYASASPTPEPQTWALFALGLGGIAVARLRRRA